MNLPEELRAEIARVTEIIKELEDLKINPEELVLRMMKQHIKTAQQAIDFDDSETMYKYLKVLNEYKL